MMIIEEKFNKLKAKMVRVTGTIVTNEVVGPKHVVPLHVSPRNSGRQVRIRFQAFDGRRLWLELEREDAISLAESISNAAHSSRDYHKEF